MESTNNYMETDLGNVSPNPKGTYTNEESYEYLDLVEYQGGSYLCTAELGTKTTGIAPVPGKNTDTWQMVALSGNATQEYIEKHTEVIEKSKQVEASRAAVEQCKKEVEAAQLDVEQMRQDTQQAAQNAETARNGAQESEQNAAASRNLANTHKEAAETAKNAAETAAQEAEQSKTAAETAAQETEQSKTAAETAAQNAAQSKADIDSIKAGIEEAAKGENVSQIQKNMQDISQLKESLGNKITKFYASNQGETHITDSDNGKIQDMMIYGKSSQDGTPTPENPVEIRSVVNPTVKVTNEDALKVQSVTLNNITLNAIPVSSGGNVTINGQQYVADYVDVERGKVVRKCERKTLNTKNGKIDEEYRLSINIAPTTYNDGSRECVFSTFKWSNWGTCAAGRTIYIKEIKKPNNELYTAQELKELSLDFDVVYQLLEQQETDLTAEQTQAFKALATYYPTTNISANSEQLDGYTVFNYPISMQNGWNYVKQQLNDNRDYIYGMDTQSAEAYVNSEYAVALTELEVM